MKERNDNVAKKSKVCVKNIHCIVRGTDGRITRGYAVPFVRDGSVMNHTIY